MRTGKKLNNVDDDGNKSLLEVIRKQRHMIKCLELENDLLWAIQKNDGKQQ